MNVWAVTCFEAHFNKTIVRSFSQDPPGLREPKIIGNFIHADRRAQLKLVAYRDAIAKSASTTGAKLYNADPFGTASHAKTAVEYQATERLKQMVPPADVDAREQRYADLRAYALRIKHTLLATTVVMNRLRALRLVGNSAAAIVIPAHAATLLTGSVITEGMGYAYLTTCMRAEVTRATALRDRFANNSLPEVLEERRAEIRRKLGTEKGDAYIASLTKSDLKAANYLAALGQVSRFPTTLNRAFEKADITKTSTILELARVREHMLNGAITTE